MKKKKNNKTLFFVFFAIILTIIALIATSGTYAKYTSSITTEEATGYVAKWSVKVNGSDIATSENIEFNIFDDENILDEKGGVATDGDVASGKIAPGTTGMVEFEILNESEVNIMYSIKFTETNNSSIPIEYSIDDENYYNASGLTNALNANPNKIGMGASDTVTLHWRWAYESENDNDRDTNDTSLGVAAQNTSTTPKYMVSAQLVATQVD